MNFNRIALALVVFLVASIPAVPALDVLAAEPGQKVKNADKKPLAAFSKEDAKAKLGLQPNESRVIVIYKDDVKKQDRDKLVQKGGKIKQEIGSLDAVAVQIDQSKVKNLSSDPNVARVIEDDIIHASLDFSVPNIGANTVHSGGFTGHEVRVCIVDTGVDDTHPALNPLVAQIDFVNGDTDATDDHGHGTHVAGIVASRDATFKGVAPDAQLMAAKVLDSTGSGFSSDVAAGINWCVANGADVINLSLGGSVFTSTCDGTIDAMAVNDAFDAGVVVAAASGNDGFINAISTPACASGAIAVGAVDDADARTVFSNEGTELDLVAPGVDIMSSRAPFLGGGFFELTGTSMATPHVAGLAALMLDKNSNLTPQQVEAIMESTALDLTDEAGPGFDTVYGWGRIQADDAVAATAAMMPTGIISVNAGGPGTEITVSGRDFADTTMTIKFDSTTLATPTASGGRITNVPVAIPNTATPGMHSISVSDGSVSFTKRFIVISPRVTATETFSFLATTNSGIPGDTVNLYGKGFAGNSGATVTISFDGVPVTSTPVSGVGSFKAIPLTIPPGAAPGPHTITATDGTNTALSTFYVFPAAAT